MGYRIQKLQIFQNGTTSSLNVKTLSTALFTDFFFIRWTKTNTEEKKIQIDRIKVKHENYTKITTHKYKFFEKNQIIKA